MFSSSRNDRELHSGSAAFHPLIELQDQGQSADNPLGFDDPLWLFKPGTSPLAKQIFFAASVGLLFVLGTLFMAMIMNGSPMDQIVHIGVFTLLAVGLLGSVAL